MPEIPQFVQDRFFDLSIDMLCIAHFSGYFQKLNPAWGEPLGSRERSCSQSECLSSFIPKTANVCWNRTA
jgi:hypothetical protein